ncbi:hypothetical protein AWENTII_009133 [Aspergillus wentii]
MVEFEPGNKKTKKKSTPIAQNDRVKLRFSYLPTDTAVHCVSNFRMKDVSDKTVQSPDVKRLETQLPARPQPPVKPESPDLRLTTLEAYRDAIAKTMEKYGPSMLNRARLAHWNEEIKKYKESEAYTKGRAEYGAKLRYYNRAKLTYDARVKDYDLRVQEELKKAGQEYERLKQEWDDHQRRMNELVVFDEFIFRVEYCDAKNGKNLGTAIAAAEKALAAEKAAKAAEAAEQAAEQAAGQAAEEAKQKAKAAAEKAHDDEVEKRKKLVFPSLIFQYDQWLAQKKKLERTACLLDDGKAAKLREDIKSKDKNVTLCAEWDLDEDILTATSKLLSNPFFVPAIAQVKVPDSK